MIGLLIIRLIDLRVKTFLCNLWAWAKVYIVSYPSSSIDFVDWLGFKGVLFFVVPLFPF